jgi:hypothetical protein
LYQAPFFNVPDQNGRKAYREGMLRFFSHSELRKTTILSPFIKKFSSSAKTPDGSSPMIASVKTTQRRFTMVSEIQIKIRGYHIDHFGHVNNGKYYGFFEEGRWSYFDDKPELLDYFHTNELMHVVALKSVIDVLALVN